VKTLVKLDDAKTGRPVYMNPDDVSAIYQEGKVTVIRMRSGSSFTTTKTLDEVVKFVNASE